MGAASRAPSCSGSPWACSASFSEKGFCDEVVTQLDEARNAPQYYAAFRAEQGGARAVGGGGRGGRRGRTQRRGGPGDFDLIFNWMGAVLERRLPASPSSGMLPLIDEASLAGQPRLLRDRALCMLPGRPSGGKLAALRADDTRLVGLRLGRRGDHRDDLRQRAVRSRKSTETHAAYIEDKQEKTLQIDRCTGIRRCRNMGTFAAVLSISECGIPSPLSFYGHAYCSTSSPPCTLCDSFSVGTARGTRPDPAPHACLPQ